MPSCGTLRYLKVRSGTEGGGVPSGPRPSSSSFSALFLLLAGAAVAVRGGGLTDAEVREGALRKSSRVEVGRVVSSLVAEARGLVATPSRGLWLPPLPIPVTLVAGAGDSRGEEALLVWGLSSLRGLGRGLGARLVVVLVPGSWLTRARAAAALRGAWTLLSASNVVALGVFPGHEESGRERAFFYDPFRDEAVELSSDDAVWERLEERWRDAAGFPLRVAMARSFLGYDARRGDLEATGLDGAFLSVLGRGLNLSLRILEVASPGEFLSNNGSYTGALGEVSARRADVALNSRFIRDPRTPELLFSSALYHEEVCAVLEAAGPLRGWHVLARIYRWEVWLGVAWTGGAAGLVAAVALGRERGRSASWSESLPGVLRALLAVPLAERVPGTPARVLTSSLLLAGLVLVSTYQARLYALVKSRASRPDPRDLAQLAARTTRVLAEPELSACLEGFGDPALRDLASRLEVRPGPVTEAWFSEGGAAVLVKMREFRLMRASGRLGARRLHVVPQCPRAYSVGYAFPRSSPFLEPLDRLVVSRVSEAGLLEPWFRAALRGERHLHPPPPLPPAPSPATTTTLQDVEVGVVALGLGLSAALVVFLLEIAYRRFRPLPPSPSLPAAPAPRIPFAH